MRFGAVVCLRLRQANALYPTTKHFLNFASDICTRGRSPPTGGMDRRCRPDAVTGGPR